MQRFHETGCKTGVVGTNSWPVVTADFIDEFDVVVVMHDPGFIRENWDKLRRKPVIWRTIGQGLDVFEPYLASPRQQGLSVVRYSPREADAPDFIGADAMIRFHKEPECFGSWSGDIPKIITVAASLRNRYPEDYEAFLASVEGLDYAIVGGGNDGLPNATGYVDDDGLAAALRNHRVYVHCAGLRLPYTLAFIEAWMTGIPVVAFASSAATSPGLSFYEAGALIEHGVNGFVARTPEEARGYYLDLLGDYELARRIGESGRRRAAEIFSRDVAEREWTRLFDALTAS